MGEKEVGVVSTYFNNVGVAAVKLSESLKVGDQIRVKGFTTDFVQKVGSIQVGDKKMPAGKKGDHVGIKVDERARPNDKVFVIE